MGLTAISAFYARTKSEAGQSLATIATLLGIISTALTIITQLGAFGDFRIPGLPGKAVEPSLSLSKGSGPSGTEVTIEGSNFQAGETVDIRFHTEQIATAQAQGDGGSFSVPARIPGSFDAFAPQQFDVIAVGRSSSMSASVPFQLTSETESTPTEVFPTSKSTIFERLPNPELSISRGAGPSATAVTVTGTGFAPGDNVQIRFHTEQIATARAAEDGTFSVQARIPGSFDAFAPQQFDIVASGRSSGSATVPFQLTG